MTILYEAGTPAVPCTGSTLFTTKHRQQLDAILMDHEEAAPLCDDCYFRRECASLAEGDENATGTYGGLLFIRGQVKDSRKLHDLATTRSAPSAVEWIRDFVEAQGGEVFASDVIAAGDARDMKRHVVVAARREAGLYSWTRGQDKRRVYSTQPRPRLRPEGSRPKVDEALITVILDGPQADARAAARAARGHERVLVVQRWLARGGSSNDLARRTGWKPERYKGAQGEAVAA